jgi:hypothetical protein
VGATPPEEGDGLALEESLGFVVEELVEVEDPVSVSSVSVSVEKQLGVAVAVEVDVDVAVDVDVDVAVDVSVDVAVDVSVDVAVEVSVEVAVEVSVDVDVAVDVEVDVAVEVDVSLEVDDGKQLWSSSWRAVRPDGRKLGMTVPKPVGSEKGNGYPYGYPPDAEGVGVGVLGGVVACAGHVSASSRYWICGWPASVITVAEACVSCAPGVVAT